MLQIIRCVRCPDRYDALIDIYYCDKCEYNNHFHNNLDGYINCEFDDGEI